MHCLGKHLQNKIKSYIVSGVFLLFLVPYSFSFYGNYSAIKFLPDVVVHKFISLYTLGFSKVLFLNLYLFFVFVTLTYNLPSLADIYNLERIFNSNKTLSIPNLLLFTIIIAMITSLVLAIYASSIANSWF